MHQRTRRFYKGAVRPHYKDGIHSILKLRCYGIRLSLSKELIAFLSLYSLSPQFHTVEDATSETYQLLQVLNIVSEMKAKSLSQKSQDDGDNEKCVMQYLHTMFTRINDDLQFIGTGGACRGGSEGRNNLQPRMNTKNRALGYDAVRTYVHDLVKNGDQLELVILLLHYYMHIINCLLKAGPESADNMVHAIDTFFQNLVDIPLDDHNRRNVLRMLEGSSPVTMRRLTGLNELGIQFDKEIVPLKHFMIQLLETTTNGFHIGSLSLDKCDAVAGAMEETFVTITTNDGVADEIIFVMNNNGRTDCVVYPSTITCMQGREREVCDLYFIHPDDRDSVCEATHLTREGENIEKLLLRVVTNDGKTYLAALFSTSIRRDGYDKKIGVEFTGSVLLEQEYERENASKRRRTEMLESDSSSGNSSSEETVCKGMLSQSTAPDDDDDDTVSCSEENVLNGMSSQSIALSVDTEVFADILSITSDFAECDDTSLPMGWVDSTIPLNTDDGGDDMNDSSNGELDLSLPLLLTPTQTPIPIATLPLSPLLPSSPRRNDSSNEELDLLLLPLLLPPTPTPTPTPIPIATNGNDFVVGNNNFQPIVDELPTQPLPSMSVAISHLKELNRSTSVMISRLTERHDIEHGMPQSEFDTLKDICARFNQLKESLVDIRRGMI